ncbi:MAG: S8 family serine peptidase [Pseudomonadota bacterium]
MIRRGTLTALSLTLIAATTGSVSSAAPRVMPDVSELTSATAKKITRKTLEPDSASGSSSAEARYIIQFDRNAVPLAIATTLERISGQPVESVDIQSPEAVQEASQLESEQNAMLDKISNEAGAIEVVRTHQHALNAAVVRMSAATAAKVAAMPGVRAVERDQAVELSTPTSVPFIGADQVWDGTATGGVSYLGEGTVVGIIDSGINHAHPSFAATGGDGYTVINPLGEGTYLGECATIADLCNSKLIGAYTFLDSQTSDPPDEALIPGDPPSRDTDGHGSHVAATAAGNVVNDVALPDADGNPGSIVFDQIAGVAPHANIVAFKVCAPSCFFSDIAAAVDQAITDGVVDVLNHSIGSPAGSPWVSTQALAFLNARAAGIFVANSAGNSGPGAGTAEAAGNAPWVAGVAATTHDRSFPPKFLEDMAGGDTTPPADITGRAVSGAITGNIVYAGDFPTSNGSDNDTQPEQCLDPFPEGTFTSDQIVMCDRGAIARVAKGQNVRDGGAGGFILGNTDGGATSVNNDFHVIPAIHINAADAALMRTWLASGDSHTGTVTAALEAISDPAAGDNLADFSSRGPYTGFDILAPNTAAPGVDILAAGAELTPEQVELIAILYAGTPSETPAVAGEYGAIAGTSMASPHIAGTAALLKQAHPEWTDAEILSAIMTTGTWDLVKEDGTTPADPFDFGAGRVQVAEAVNAGLLLDETSTSFEDADPGIGGDPKTLNVAALVNESCVFECTWTRTVTATEGGTWDVSSPDVFISVSPTSFTLASGESQEIEVTANSSGLPAEDWVFGRVNMTPSDSDGPEQHLTMAIIPASGELPGDVSILAGRDADSYLIEGIESVEITDLQTAVGGLVAATSTDMSLLRDSANGSAFDDLSDGVDFIVVPTTGGETRFVAFTEDATTSSPDLDLFVGFDTNGNGLPDSSEELCRSTSASATEVCDLTGTFGAGNVWVLVQNWGGSTETPDDLVLSYALVGGPTGNLSVIAPASVPQLVPFDVRLVWDLPEPEVGTLYFGTVTLGTDAANPSNVGTIPVTIGRGPDDVNFFASTDSADPGEAVTFSIEVAANGTPEERNYAIAAEVPAGLTLIPDSVTGGGTVKDGMITWDVSQASLLNTPPSYPVINSDETAACAVPFSPAASGTGDSPYADLEGFGIFPQPDLTGDSVTFSGFPGQNFNFFGETFTGGFNFTDDGFAFFGDPAANSGTPFFNQPIPSGDLPNSLMAILWRDFVIPPAVTTPGSVEGVSLGSAGPNLSLLEYDNMSVWTPSGVPGADRIDMQMAIFGGVDDSPGAYEIIMAYDNLENYDAIGSNFGTIGVENADGSSGTQVAFNTVAVKDDFAICFDLTGPSPDPVVLTYQATLDEAPVGTTVTSTVSSEVDSVGSEVVEGTVDVSIAEPPVPGDINEDGFVDRADVDLIFAARNSPADGPDDPRDMNGDGVINVLDARLVTLECTLPGCATPAP